MNTEITQITNFLNNKIKTRNYIKSTVVLSAILLGCLSVKSQTVETFNYTGSMQTYTVPAGVNSIQIECTAGSGYAEGGEGGYVTGEFSVVPGEVLEIYVGGQGTYTDGGFNGGGNTGSSNGYGGGGGASDVRQAGSTLNDRIVVAGGGGGPGSNCGAYTAPGGKGGGLTGESGCLYSCSDCRYTGAGGSQIAGGITGIPMRVSCSGESGTFGLGGSNLEVYGTGGGGGYYGGGAGCFEGAGGGSSYTDASATNVTHLVGTNAGHGFVVITTPCIEVGTSIILNSNDNGPGSLRELVSGSCRNDTLVFDASTNGHPIVLSSGQITLHKDIVITGIDSASTIIDGGDLGRIFNIAPGVTVTLNGVKLQNGKTKEGGAIYNAGDLTLNTVLLTNNKAEISNPGHTKGGAIYNKGIIAMNNSSLITNSATSIENSNSYGGAIYNAGTITMVSCIANGNSVESFHGLVLGGAIYNGKKAVCSLQNCSMNGNSATSEYYGFGGAIVNRRYVTLNYFSSTFNDNTSTSKGDQIYNVLSPNFINTPSIGIIQPTPPLISF